MRGYATGLRGFYSAVGGGRLTGLGEAETQPQEAPRSPDLYDILVGSREDVPAAVTSAIVDGYKAYVVASGGGAGFSQTTIPFGGPDAATPTRVPASPPRAESGAISTVAKVGAVALAGYVAWRLMRGR